MGIPADWASSADIPPGGTTLELSGPIREHHDDLSSRILTGILHGQEQAVIGERHRRPATAGAHATDELGAIRKSKRRRGKKIAAVGIESHFVRRCAAERNEISDGGPCAKDEATVHVIAGIEQE